MVRYLAATAALLLSIEAASGITFGSLDDAQHLRKPAKLEHSQCSVELQGTNIVVDGHVWMTLGSHVCTRRDGEEFCAQSAKSVRDFEGTDALGPFVEEAQVIGVGNGREWEIGFRKYNHDPSTLQFRQTFLSDLQDTAFPDKNDISSATNGTASWFPSFRMNTGEETECGRGPLGYLEMTGFFMGGAGFQIGPLEDLNKTDALMSGPLAIFSNKCVVIMSTSSSFMSSSSLYRQEFNEFGYGVMGSIPTIPKGHSMSVILSSSRRHGPDGIRQAFSDWGAKLQTLYGTRRIKDVTLDYLQYSTDNGAYYYYQTKENANYQDTILEVKKVTEQIGLPFRSWLLDSWFYYKGEDQGLKEWVARPDIFPDGIAKLQEATKWFVMAHNRYWSNETVYAKQNGGDYEFAIEGYALPLEERFWDYFFDKALEWGLTVYEQDWLNHQTQGTRRIMQSVDAGRQWLLQMGASAKRHNLPIQYCMSWPRHILQSLEVDAVTQARASDDVRPANNKSLELGITSMFAHALGIAPHKDSFWSNTADPPRNPYKKTEPTSKLLSVIATYSTAPVAPSDKEDYLDVPLIMRSCAKDGTLLKPDLPAVRTDKTIMAQAGFHSCSEQAGEVWSTKSDLTGYTYSYILSADSKSFNMTVGDVYPSSQVIDGHIAWRLDAPKFSALNLPFKVPDSNFTNISVHGVAPIFPNGWCFLGEATTKWTAVSRNRFSQLVVRDDGFSVTIIGAPKELVQMVVRTPTGQFVHVSATVAPSGLTSLECSDATGCLTTQTASSSIN